MLSCSSFIKKNFLILISQFPLIASCGSHQIQSSKKTPKGVYLFIPSSNTEVAKNLRDFTTRPKLKSIIIRKKIAAELAETAEWHSPVIDEALHNGAVIQNEADGTRYACALLSLLTAYNACHNLKAIQIPQERSLLSSRSNTSRPSFKKLVDFYDRMPYFGGVSQTGYLFRYTPEAYLQRHGYEGDALARELSYYKGPKIHYSSRKIGNDAWTKGMDFLGLNHRELNPFELTKSELKDEIITAIKTPGMALMFHGYNHYTCIGGYEILEDGRLLLQLSYTNQRPNTWVPLADIACYLKKSGNSRLYVVSV